MSDTRNFPAARGAGKTGVWLLGARGSIATCVLLGAALLRKRRIDATGMVTAHPRFSPLGFVEAETLCFAGHEIRSGSALETASSMLAHRVLTEEQIREAREDLELFESRLRKGIDGRAEKPLEAIEKIQADLREFREREKLDCIVVVNVASTEAYREMPSSWNALESFQSPLRAGSEIPASVLYAYAAIDAGFPYVNFTPSWGATPGALQQLAVLRGVPHAGRDGKTGETLLKTALAPMFRDRNLRVLSWEGYNMLGNGDGKTLADPAHRESKLKSKDEGLRRILGDEQTHTKVTIDYVPSLDDWKTAWDYIHFRGFLGVGMSLQFTWQGSDSALAAPLVLDLVRLAEFAARHGESGAMTHTASFFKSPLGCEEQDFHRQFAMLEAYLARHATAKGR